MGGFRKGWFAFLMMGLMAALPARAETGAAADAAEKVIPPSASQKEARVKGPMSFTYGRFGEIAIYPPKGAPTALVLFVSGDGGWNLGVVDMAQSLASKGALVAGIDLPHFYRTLVSNNEKCTYPAADFEQLAHALEAQFNFPQYRYPYLVGYSSGATLVYALLAQAPAGTFAGAISLGFCPDIELSVPLCESNLLKRVVRTTPPKGFDLAAVSKLPAPWIVLNGEIDQVCLPAATAQFVNQVKGGELVSLPRVGHGFSVQANWMPHYLAAYDRLLAHTAEAVTKPARTDQGVVDVSDLPLTEVPASEGQGKALAVILTGDGGWAGLDREIAAALVARGVPVVGFSSLQYFWKARTPEQTAADFERVMRHYLAAWKREAVILVGYSMGAEVLPFVVNHLSADMQAKVATVAAIAPGRTAQFEFHFSHWVGKADEGKAVLPEMEKMPAPLTCIYPLDEKDSLCGVLDQKRNRVVGLPGGHHFNGDYQRLAGVILQGLDKISP